MTHRLEKDSMGDVKVPSNAVYGAQTQRAVDNFQISGWRMAPEFIKALAHIKYAAADANQQLELLATDKATAIKEVAAGIAKGEYADQFPVDVFQTGSGTSSNMNMNEVIAGIAAKQGVEISPNDDVNMGQSSNDVIPTAIQVATSVQVKAQLYPAIKHLIDVISAKGKEYAHVVTTGRTHLMDAMPVTLEQEFSAWIQQLEYVLDRVDSTLPRLNKLAQGGTAVGTGINSHPKFAKLFCKVISKRTGIEFVVADNYFERLACQDTSVELSGQFRTLAVALIKISNDLRWKNSGPLAGLSELVLPALQPGSSIMPGKVNPVIPEAVMMACTEVMGLDAAVGIAGQSASFQLHVMLPMIAHNLLCSIRLLSNSCTALADKAIQGLVANVEKIKAPLDANPILVTALNSKIGYLEAARIAKLAYSEQKTILEVAQKETDIPEAELKQLLDPVNLTRND